MLFIMLKLFLLICICTTIASQNLPQLKIDHGTLTGSYRKTWSGRIFSSFTGIPYAEPPIGKLRFMAPVPAGAWKGSLDASKPHAICPQMNVYEHNHNISGDEDCLYLNVYTPQLETSNNRQLLPVMFYIHGGGWMTGSANLYGPNILLDHDVVLVTTNYRLGALGFLSTGDKVVPGNNGLKDQNLALKWVKKNIVHFGGDPNSITVFGQSAGAASAHYHMLSPLSKDLITGAILHSGSALAPWALGLPSLALNNTKNLANFVNCPYTSSEVLIDCLRHLPAREIVAQDLKFLEWSYHPMIPFKPVIEEESNESFLTEEPADIIKSNKAAQIPMIVGFTTEDGAFKSAYLFKQSELLKQLNNNFNRMAPFLLVYHESTSNQDKISETVRKFYFADGKLDDKDKGSITDMVTDSWFHHPADTTVRLHNQYTDQKVYYYLFGYRGSQTFTDLFKSADDHYDYGVCHCDDLLYLFNFDFFPKNKSNKNDQNMNTIVSTLWTNFAKTGNPTPKTNDVIKTEWQSVKTRKNEYYYIKNNEEIEMRSNLNSKQLKIWKNIPYNARWKQIKDEL